MTDETLSDEYDPDMPRMVTTGIQDLSDDELAALVSELRPDRIWTLPTDNTQARGATVVEWNVIGEDGWPYLSPWLTYRDEAECYLTVTNGPPGPLVWRTRTDFDSIYSEHVPVSDDDHDPSREPETNDDDSTDLEESA